MFMKNNFVAKFRDLSPKEIERTYKQIVDTVIDKINGILYCGGTELVIKNRQFFIQNINSEVKLETPVTNQIDREYIKELSDKANIDIKNNNFDSAITKSRTLMEEVFCYAIEQKNEEPNSSGDIIKLFNQVKNLYSMHQDHNQDRRINDLLSGLNKIIDSISQMRNNSSDSHGIGKRRIGIAEYHARLFLNTSIVMAEFILTVAQIQNEKDRQV